MPDTANTPAAGSKKNDSKNTQGAAQSPDAVQKGMLDFWGWLEQNAKLVAALVVVFVIGAIAYVALQSFKSYQERTAQKAYYDVEAKYTKIREGFDRAKFKAIMPEATQDTNTTDQPATGDLAKDYGTVISDLEKVARDHAGTAAGAQASILASEVYLEYNQPDKAAELSQLTAKSMGDKDLLANLAKVQLGNALSAKGDCQGAVGVWQQVLDNKAATFLHADVGLRSGVCFEQLNQPDKAAEMYRKVTSESADSAAATTAKGLLRALELKKQG